MFILNKTKVHRECRKLRWSLLSLVTAITLGITLNAGADTRDIVDFNIKPQTVASALVDFGVQGGVTVGFSDEIVRGYSTKGISGVYPVIDALAKLLDETGLSFQVIDGKTVSVGKKAAVSESGGRSMEVKNTELESKSTDNNLEIDEIIVTASRREQRLQDVAMAISAVNPEEFTESGLTSLNDIIEYTPGVYFKNNALGRPGSGGSVTARGVGQEGSSPVVAVYLDDVPLTSSGPWTFSHINAFDGLLGDIERVELLKGPQGTLYGATSIGGAIRYITRKPSLDEFRGNASVSLSTPTEGGFNKMYSGRFSTPVVEDKLGITIAGFYEDKAGIVDRVDMDTGVLLVEDANGIERYGISGDMLYKFSDRFEFRARFMNQKTEASGSSLVMLNINTLKPLFGQYDSVESVSVQEQENTYYAGTFEYQFDKAVLTSTSSYVKDRNLFAQDAVAQFGAFADILQGQPIGTTTNLDAGTNVGSEKIVQEIRLTSEANDTWEWMLGLFYTDEDSFNSRFFIAQPNDFNLLTSDRPTRYEEYAAFANLTYYVTPDFDLTVGARISRNTTELNDTRSGALAGPSVYSDVTDTVDTWLFAARYRINQDLSLYSRMASGYRPASANVSSIDPITGNELAPYIASDTLWSYEVGAKGDLADDLLSYDIALWYIEWDNFQTSISLSGVGGRVNAEGGITGKGLESTFIFRPFEGLSITSGIAYTDSTLNENERLLSGLAGQQVSYVPKWTASTRARYDFILSSGTEAHVGGGFRYTDSSRSGFTDNNGTYIPGLSDPVADAPFDPTFNVPTDSYILVDLNAGITWENISFVLYATNLFDERAFVSTDGDVQGGSIILATGVPVLSRTLGATFSFSF